MRAGNTAKHYEMSQTLINLVKVEKIQGTTTTTLYKK